MPDPTSQFSLDALNRADPDQALRMLERVTERSPWFAQRLAEGRPYADAAGLLDRIGAEIAALDRQERLALLRAHPELAPPAPQAMTAASQEEQGRLALARPGAADAGRLASLNADYRRRHGYPFVIALHAHADMASVIAQFESRLGSDPEREMERALAEVVSVAKARLVRLTGQAQAGDGQAAP